MLVEVLVAEQGRSLTDLSKRVLREKRAKNQEEIFVPPPPTLIRAVPPHATIQTLAKKSHGSRVFSTKLYLAKCFNRRGGARPRFIDTQLQSAPAIQCQGQLEKRDEPSLPLKALSSFNFIVRSAEGVQAFLFRHHHYGPNTRGNLVLHLRAGYGK